MKILVDMQATQSEDSANRGIGRYTSDLVNALEKIEKDTIKLYNNLYDNVLENKVFIPVDFSNKNLLEKYKYDSINDCIIKYHIHQTNPDIFLLASPFEGSRGKAVTVEGKNYLDSIFATILYDLIPYIFQDHYLSNEEVKIWYHKKLKLFFESDIIFAISQSAKEDIINFLGIEEEKVINISGAIDKNKFYKLNNIDYNVLRKLNIIKPFILYTGGIDFRKNIESSIIAFSKINKNLLNKYQYVIVCKITEQEKKYFENLLKKYNLENKVIFTGFISDEELNILYNTCDLFIFPSIYEGFGLPVLEAMSCRALVCCSNTSSLPEIVQDNNLMFNPTDTDDIKNKIEYLLNLPEKKKEEIKNELYNKAQNFSWDKSAFVLFNSLKKLKKNKIRKKRLAYFSPLPPLKSGISDYSKELLPFLSKYFEIDLFVDQNEVSDFYLKANYNIYQHSKFRNRAKMYDEIIYNFGNSAFHDYMIDYIKKYQGNIILHDFYISGMLQYATQTRGESFFVENLLYSHPESKVALEKYYKNEITLEDIIINYPANRFIFEYSKNVFFHSMYNLEQTHEFYDSKYDEKIKIINQPVKIPYDVSFNKSEFKEELGFNKDVFIITVFGHISYSKLHDEIIKKFIEDKLFFKNIKLVFVGDYVDEHIKNEIETLLRENKLFNSVFITGYVTEEKYIQYLKATDLSINLRKNSRGETSRALLVNMAYGIPTIVNDYATFKYYSDDTVIKIKNFEEIGQTINFLLNNSTLLKKIGENAFLYVKDKHHPAKVAKNIFEQLNNESEVAQFDIIKCIAEKIVLKDLDKELNDKDYYKIAETVKKNFKLIKKEF